MLDWKTKAVGVLLPAVLTMFACAPARGDDISVAGSSNGPPAGITPVTIKLQTVLDAFDATIGRVAHKSITHIQERTISAYGLTGTYREVDAGLHYADDVRSTMTLGPFSTARGRRNGQRWRRDENGVTTVLQDTVRADENDLGGFTADTENPKNEVKLLGEVSYPFPAYIVQVKRKNLAPFWAYYNKQTGLLNRVEIGYHDDREAYTFDDYRLANGIREPWRLHMSDDDSRNDFDSRVTLDEYGKAVTPQDLAIPPTRPDVVRFPAGTAQVVLPSDITVISLIPFGISATFADPMVRVNIGGRTMDMLLDSSENGMVLDDQTAKDLGLATYGPYEKDEKGHWYPTRAVIPSLRIGDLEMSHLVVKCQHVDMFEGNGRPVAGVLGFDFLANAVVEVDYVGHVVKAFDPASFMPPADSVPTPVNIDDGIPFVSAQVGSSVGEHFVLRTTAPITALFPSFWQAHPDDVKDQGKGRELNFRLFFAADSALKATQLKGFYFGGVRFYEWLAYEVMDSDHLTEGLDIDGVIGCDFLQYFNVYFDYDHQLVYLEQNDVFKQAEAKNRGGR